MTFRFVEVSTPATLYTQSLSPEVKYPIVFFQCLVTTATRLGEITTDFRLGFGAYNEKPIIPFIIPGRILYIPELGLIASTDYSYRHVVSLTDNITLFRVSRAPTLIFK